MSEVIKPGEPVTMPMLLLLAGDAAHDPDVTDEGRASAEATFAHLIACAAAHGLSARQCDRLRELCRARAIATPEAIALSRAALDHVPASAIRRALDRAGFRYDS